MAKFCGGPLWDWAVSWNTTSPDFTPCFERTVLAALPCSFLWTLGALDAYFSFHSKHPPLPWNALNTGKAVITLTLAGLELIFLTVAQYMFVTYPVDIYMPVIRLLTLVLSFVLLLYSKRYGVRSSGIQFIFWLLLCLTQAIRFRTVLLQTKPDATDVLKFICFLIEVVYLPVVYLQLFLHCWADKHCDHIDDYELLPDDQSSPEENSSFLCNTFFHWFTPLAWAGYKRPLGFADLPVLPEDLRSKSTPEEQKSKVKINLWAHLVKVWLAENGWSFFVAFIIRLVPDLMIFVAPVLFSLIIDYISSGEPTWRGVFYAVLLFLNAVLSTILAANSIHVFYKVGISLKSYLIGAVYKKALRLSNSARRQLSQGEMLNRMAVDVQYVTEALINGNLGLTAPFIILLALIFLWNILGLAALAGGAVMILCLPVNAYLASKVQKLQKQQMIYKDERTKLISQILHGIKVVKLNAWEPSFEDKVTGIRAKEVVILKRVALWNSATNFLWSCSPVFAAFVTFVTFVAGSSTHTLDAKTAFVSLSLFNIMGQALVYFPMVMSWYIKAKVGIIRLKEFLNAEEIDINAVSCDPSHKYAIAMDRASFSWDATEEPTLKNISLYVADRQLVGVVGVVGSGKSSLLSALLNEMDKISGQCNVRGKIAYVPQQPWIKNGTIRENILFGNPFEDEKYTRILDACALFPDMENLPAGDQTEIGEKGVNLSGGQKQRVSLARAVYSEADVYLLDDPLSGVDTQVGRQIFSKVIGPKSLTQDKTRIFVTHSGAHLPHMNGIVVMENGKIIESGTYAELFFVTKNRTFSDLIRKHSFKARGEAAQKKRQELKERRGKRRDTKPARQESKLIEIEKLETENVRAGVYIDYFRAAEWKLVATTLVMYLLFQSLSISGSLWLSHWTSLPPSETITRTGFYLSIYGLFGGLQAIAILIASILMTFGCLQSGKILHSRMLQSVLRAPLQFFDVTPIGRVLNRFSRDVDALDSTLPNNLRYLLNAIFNVLAVMLVITLSTPWFAVVIVPITGLYYLIQKFYVGTSRQLKRLEAISRSPIYSHFGESINGTSTIRAYRQESRFIQEAMRLQDANMTWYYQSVAANRWLQIRLESVGNLVVFFAALFAVIGRDSLTPGVVGLSISYALQITLALLFLVRFTSDVESNIVAVERVKEYSECPQESNWTVGRNILDWPTEGQVAFDNYQLRYRPGLELVLKGISCQISAKEKVGLVGRTGAGKSSVTLGLFRILEAEGGRILIDGKNIAEVGLHDLRDNLTIIPQDPVLFSGNLRFNLDPLGIKRDEELHRVLALSGLKEFVEGSDGGLDFMVAEGGDNLSAGQKQLVCLARALLRKTKILVLDEATSAVDMETEQFILETIRAEFQDSTVLTIAHRLDTVMDCDRVIVMVDGEIKEVGVPAELLANETSLFYTMTKENY